MINFLLDVCGGALVSPRLVLSAFHCPQTDTGAVCKNGSAILGGHNIDIWSQEKYYTIKIVDVLFPNETRGE